MARSFPRVVSALALLLAATAACGRHDDDAAAAAEEAGIVAKEVEFTVECMSLDALRSSLRAVQTWRKQGDPASRSCPLTDAQIDAVLAADARLLAALEERPRPTSDRSPMSAQERAARSARLDRLRALADAVRAALAPHRAWLAQSHPDVLDFLDGENEGGSDGAPTPPR